MIDKDYVENKKAILEQKMKRGITKTNVPSTSLIFISTTKGLNKLNPRVPKNFFTENGFEENTIKRVCFSTSIDKCLMALSMNCTGKTFYVYKPKKKYPVYKPSTQLVPDAKVTNEHWILEPVELQYCGKIKCTGDSGEPGIKFKYGSHTAELYEWNYEWNGDLKI